MKKLLLSVVLYGRLPKESETIVSLVRCSKELDLSNVTLLLWNNGPSCLKSTDREWLENQLSSVKIRYQETVNNLSLAKIYNSVSAEAGFDYYSFWDHDSILTAEYISQAQREVFDILVPLILVGGKSKLPKILGRRIEKKTTYDEFRGGLRTVLSGLVLSGSLISAYRSTYGEVFDSRYAFYGVDSSFFLRLDFCARNNDLKLLVAPSVSHSLSRLEDESSAIKRFRRIERGWDLGITLKHYLGTAALGALSREILKTVLARPNVSWKTFVKGYLVGKHPRSDAE